MKRFKNYHAYFHIHDVAHKMLELFPKQKGFSIEDTNKALWQLGISRRSITDKMYKVIAAYTILMVSKSPSINMFSPKYWSMDVIVQAWSLYGKYNYIARL